MDPKSLRVFLSVADALNFSRVSEISHMSVSAVSRIIARLKMRWVCLCCNEIGALCD